VKVPEPSGPSRTPFVLPPPINTTNHNVETSSISASDDNHLFFIDKGPSTTGAPSSDDGELFTIDPNSSSNKQESFLAAAESFVLDTTPDLSDLNVDSSIIVEPSPPQGEKLTVRKMKRRNASIYQTEEESDWLIFLPIVFILWINFATINLVVEGKCFFNTLQFTL